MRSALLAIITLISLYGTASAVEMSGNKRLGLLLGESIQDINFQDFDKAETKLKTVLEAEPNNRYAKFYMGSLLYQTSRPAKAIPYLEDVLSSDLRFEGDSALLAACYLAADMPEKALPIYEALLAEDPSNEANAFQYATALEKTGESERAKAYYQSIIEAQGQYADAARFQLGIIKMQLGAYRSASDQFRQIDPKSAYGPTAKSYLDALAPTLKPVSLFVSYEYFYNTNPGSATSTFAKGAVIQTPPKASRGQTVSASLFTGAWEISDRIQSRFSYTYYGTFHTDSSAKSNDFVGHFVTPSASLAITPEWKLEGKIEYQLFDLGKHRLSMNYGGTLSLNYARTDGRRSAYASLNYMRKRYTNNFGDPGIQVDMTYLDANSPTLGLGGSITYSSLNAVLGADYKLLFERTLENTNPLLNEKSRDSAYREHSITLNHHLPFGGFVSMLDKLSMDISLGYSYRGYRYQQSGTSLPSIKPGNFLTAVTRKASGKFQYLLWPKYSLNLAAGADWARAKSSSTELSYQQARYFGQLSASF